MLRSKYVPKLQEAIRAVHECESYFVSTSHVKAVLEGHPKAKRCYAWGHVEDEQLRNTAVLEILPVDPPSTAVDVAIATKARR